MPLFPIVAHFMCYIHFTQLLHTKKKCCRNNSFHCQIKARNNLQAKNMHKASYMCLMPIRFIFDGTTKQYPDTVCERDNVMKSAFINKDSERCAIRGVRALPTHYPPPHIQRKRRSPVSLTSQKGTFLTRCSCNDWLDMTI